MKVKKAVILAGGLGTRLSEETDLIPKPMIQIGQRPILWHIMKYYSCFGINEFIVCCGYKGYVIKEYFSNYSLHNSDIKIDLEANSVEYLQKRSEPWKIHLIDTGEISMTGGRLRRVKDFIKDEESFCFTYGDGLGNININKLIEFHKEKKVLATLTTVVPPGRYGALSIKDDLVTSFVEKPKGDGFSVNGGFFVLSPKVIDFIEGDDTTWEKEPMETLAKKGQMAAFGHDGFWHAMDTLRDKRYLEELWKKDPPWKIW